MLGSVTRVTSSWVKQGVSSYHMQRLSSLQCSIGWKTTSCFSFKSRLCSENSLLVSRGLSCSILNNKVKVCQHIDLSTFERNLLVRPIRLEDFDQIVALQLKCFPGMKTWSQEQIESQLTIFPEGQICVEYQGRIVASSSSLILDFAMYADWHSWHEIADEGFIRNHTPEGNTLYGIEVMVDPEFRGMRLARRLYDARKKLAQTKNLMRIVLGGRIPGYHKYKDEMTARQYVDRVMNKDLIDPVLTTQLSNGFVLVRLLKSYLDADKESQGYATLLEWTNLDYQPDVHKVYIPSKAVRICAVQYQMRVIKSFEEFARQVEYFVDVAADYKSDFILFPELFTMQLLSFAESGTSRYCRPKALGIHATVSGTLQQIGDQIRHQHHRRLPVQR